MSDSYELGYREEREAVRAAAEKILDEGGPYEDEFIEVTYYDKSAKAGVEITRKALTGYHASEHLKVSNPAVMITPEGDMIRCHGEVREILTRLLYVAILRGTRDNS